MVAREEAAAAEPGFGAQEMVAGGVGMGGGSAKPIALAAVILLWQAVGFLNDWLHFYNPKLFPAPLDVAISAWRLAQAGVLWTDIWVSTLRVVEGVVASAPLGIVLGMLIGRVRRVEDTVEPVIELLRPIPPLALLPMIILWFGIGEASKVFFIAYSCFFVIFTTVVVGVRNIDPVLLRAGESLGLSRWQLYRFVIMQAVMPDIMLGLRLGAVGGFPGDRGSRVHRRRHRPRLSHQLFPHLVPRRRHAGGRDHDRGAGRRLQLPAAGAGAAAVPLAREQFVAPTPAPFSGAADGRARLPRSPRHPSPARSAPASRRRGFRGRW